MNFYYNGYFTYKKLIQTPTILSNGSKLLSSKMNDNLPNKSKDKTANLGFIHAFIASISVIVVSELGDKTFFIAAILAMRHSRLVVYAGAMGALGAMTVLSALLGNIVTNFVPRIYTFYISSILFAGFGMKMLKDGYGMSPDETAEEYEEVQQEVDKAEATSDLESGDGNETIDSSPKANQQVLTSKSFVTKIATIIRRYISSILIQSFIMTFLAEWGDRSQITTIVLAASENLLGVIVGGTIGHGLCTGLAVIGGRFIAQKISVKTVTLVGGVVFLAFAVSAFYIGPDK
ncbi:unnamed protein product [Rotaria magnacalcarata]|uniref:GDT1 family protein n=1 Tax=Rotaria magnacalcarata TaxID=392030 RepID=A0A815KBX2_9BILA|nr:unnamed protein product [Rotaria magnacalcarata]CAF1661188.1 unnamed protein product [Rotaria magnacalcarata]CAF2060522.1 unnamed protein product [Rotaria magnacalcarata]CAF2192363.1 unnamed protein product [Rotaria magnacalcarata]CAF3808511.1 unnamed protein product [Rotaria magnacalcarata]